MSQEVPPQKESFAKRMEKKVDQTRRKMDEKIEKNLSSSEANSILGLYDKYPDLISAFTIGMGGFLGWKWAKMRASLWLGPSEGWRYHISKGVKMVSGTLLGAGISGVALYTGVHQMRKIQPRLKEGEGAITRGVHEIEQKTSRGIEHVEDMGRDVLDRGDRKLEDAKQNVKGRMNVAMDQGRQMKDKAENKAREGVQSVQKKTGEAKESTGAALGRSTKKLKETGDYVYEKGKQKIDDVKNVALQKGTEWAKETKDAIDSTKEEEEEEEEQEIKRKKSNQRTNYVR